MAKFYSDIVIGDSNNNKGVGIYGCSGSDKWGLRSVTSANTSDDMYLELITQDNGNEPIYIRQYNSTGIVHSVTILDASGNTTFPGTVTAPIFSGIITIPVNPSNTSNLNIWIQT